MNGFLSSLGVGADYPLEVPGEGALLFDLAAAQFCLWVFQCAFWQVLLQYETDLQPAHCKSGLSPPLQVAQTRVWDMSMSGLSPSVLEVAIRGREFLRCCQSENHARGTFVSRVVKLLDSFLACTYTEDNS